jgi:hypothetical protein
MQSIVVIKRTGDVEPRTVRASGFSADTLYRRGGFSSAAGFGLLHTFPLEGYNLSLFGKREGRHNAINKFELPPPVDTPLFYGSIVVVAHTGAADQLSGATLLNYTDAMWVQDYEHLMGGFEDLGAGADEDDQEEDELADVDPALKTRSGYLKDDFVVDDTEAEGGEAVASSGRDEEEYDFDGDSCSDDDDSEGDSDGDSESDDEDLPGNGGVDGDGELVPEEYVPEK